MTILNMYSARPILPALFAARYLSWAACPHQPVAPAAGSLPRRRVLASLRALIYSTYRQQMCTFGFAYTSQKITLQPPACLPEQVPGGRAFGYPKQLDRARRNLKPTTRPIFEMRAKQTELLFWIL